MVRTRGALCVLAVNVLLLYDGGLLWGAAGGPTRVYRHGGKMAIWTLEKQYLCLTSRKRASWRLKVRLMTYGRQFFVGGRLASTLAAVPQLVLHSVASTP